jgi:hypothetical protein
VGADAQPDPNAAAGDKASLTLGELTSLALAKNWVAHRAVAGASCVALDPIASLLRAAEGAGSSRGRA